MLSTSGVLSSARDTGSLLARYRAIRATTEALCRPLQVEDYVLQAMPDVSPTRWHLAHVSWFFETFVLEGSVAGYRPFDARYRMLFNSYYNAVGPQFSRPDRGHLSRPTVAEVYAYRAHVDAALKTLLRGEVGPATSAVIELGLLLGVDLMKDVDVLRAAYDDAAGVTAAFDRNVLSVVNRELGGDFAPGAFHHLARVDSAAARVEMHLVTPGPQRVRLRALGLVLDFAAGEGIWTESSYKFTRAGVAAMLESAGLDMERWLTDADARFAVVVAAPAP